VFKKLSDLLSRSPASPPEPHRSVQGPYAQSETNIVYQLLFCDDSELFRGQPETKPHSWQSILLNEQPDVTAVRGLAEDRSQESRIRLLAYRLLKRREQKISEKELLGAVVEVPLAAGLDVIAAYLDGSIRYINQTGKFVVFEGAPPDIAAQVTRLLAASRTAITHIGPWDRARLPAPSVGKMRMTFLMSDGLYFGEGPFPGMERDAIAAPVIGEAGKLLNMVVDVALADKK
jgi:hypothetical protein